MEFKRGLKKGWVHEVTLPRYPSGTFMFDSTSEARVIKQRHYDAGSPRPPQAMSHEDNLKQAKREAERSWGITNNVHVQAFLKVQIGIYHGKTFRWLVENDFGWAKGNVLQVAAEGGNTGMSDLNDNKRALRAYIESFPDGKAALEQIFAEKHKKELKKQMFKAFREKKEHEEKVKKEREEQARKRKAMSLVASRKSPDQIARELASPKKKVQPNIPPRSPATKARVTREEKQVIAEVDQDLLTSVISPLPPSDSTSDCVSSPGVLPPATRTDIVTSTSAVVADDVKETTRSEPVPAGPTQLDVQISTPVTTTQTSTPVADDEDHSVLATVGPQQLSTCTVIATCGDTSVVTSTVPVLSELRTAASIIQSLSQADSYPLPPEWKLPGGLPKEDWKWVSQRLCQYDVKGNVVVTPGRKVYHQAPRADDTLPRKCPSVDEYHCHDLLVWYPRKIFNAELRCPKCKSLLTSGGNHQTVRRVLAKSEYYLMVTEVLRCSKRSCRGSFLGWSPDIVQQLDISTRLYLKCVLTAQAACDVEVVTDLCSRGLGNSASQIQKKLETNHKRVWNQRSLKYLTHMNTYKSPVFRSTGPVVEKIPPMIPVKKAAWLRLVFAAYIFNIKDDKMAAITSVGGNILKIDSTKKVARKLSGQAAGTAQWCTNVGNEYGQVLNSVLTCSEGLDGIRDLARGIIERYNRFSWDPPQVLYVDKECCGESFHRRLFQDWPDLIMRLDIWHFMRRFTVAVSSESHTLYPTFMKRLSACIFQWVDSDVQLLYRAKRAELEQRHLAGLPDSSLGQWVTKYELALHCRRITRGTEETTKLIGELLETFMGDSGLDTLGVALLDVEKMMHIWNTQKRHVMCIQDPEGVSLYTKTGTLKKGGVLLPKYRCARGSTSLESFHLHLAKFIPGTTASYYNFQAFLLEGLCRWNEDRERQMTTDGPLTAGSYDALLSHALNDMSIKVMNKKLVADFHVPRKYTGEKIGTDYLFAQTGEVISEDPAKLEERAERATTSDEETEDEYDEGFVDDVVVADDERTILSEPEPPGPLQLPLQQTPLSPILPCMTTPRVSTSVQTTQTTPPAVVEDDEDTLEPTPVGPPQPVSPQRFRQSTERYTSTDDDQPQPPVEDSESIGPYSIPGYAQVDRLASYLFSMRDQTEPLSNEQASYIVDLYNNLDNFDKQTVAPKPRYRTTTAKPSTAKNVRRGKKTSVVGAETIKQGFRGTDGPATAPDTNRIMEVLLAKLCAAFNSPTKVGGKRRDRWDQVHQAYTNIQQKVINHGSLLQECNLSLFHVSYGTIRDWYNDRVDQQTEAVLLQNIRGPNPPMSTTRCVPSPKERPSELLAPAPPSQQHEFVLPPVTMGKSKARRKLIPSSSPANPDTDPKQLMTPAPAAIFATPGSRGSRLHPIPILPKPAAEQEQVSVPKTTAWYRKKQEKKKAAGELVKMRVSRVKRYHCSKCGQLKTTDTGHFQDYGSWYCPSTATISREDWFASQKKRREDKKQQKILQRLRDDEETLSCGEG